MTSRLSHPWLNGADVTSRARLSMSARLKSVDEMLASGDPPQWVVLLDRMGLWYHCRIRVVIHKYATVDYEPSFDDPPTTWLLNDTDFQYLSNVLRAVAPEEFPNAHTDILDGDFCAVTVVHGNPVWLTYAEVNLSGLPETERAAVALLATRLVEIVDEAAKTQ
jgi:hypothetical protein